MMPLLIIRLLVIVISAYLNLIYNFFIYLDLVDLTLSIPMGLYPDDIPYNHKWGELSLKMYLKDIVDVKRLI